MFELFWAMWTIPKVIYPAAKSNGKSGFKWTIYAVIIFFIVEISIIAFYLFIYFAVLEKYKLPKHPGYFWVTYLIYVFALLSGLFSVDLIRKFLTKKDEIFKKI